VFNWKNGRAEYVRVLDYHTKKGKKELRLKAPKPRVKRAPSDLAASPSATARPTVKDVPQAIEALLGGTAQPKKVSVEAEVPDRVSGVADDMHALWQKNTRHKTRFKPAIDEHGNPIKADLETYFKERGIPEELRKKHYKKNKEGGIEEDIKFIPNRHLSHKNRVENDVGARAALEEADGLMGARAENIGQAEAMIRQAAENVHQKWLERNSWAKGDPQYDPAWKDLSPDMKQADIDPLKMAMNRVFNDLINPQHIMMHEALANVADAIHLPKPADERTPASVRGAEAQPKKVSVEAEPARVIRPADDAPSVKPADDASRSMLFLLEKGTDADFAGGLSWFKNRATADIYPDLKALETKMKKEAWEGLTFEAREKAKKVLSRVQDAMKVLDERGFGPKSAEPARVTQPDVEATKAPKPAAASPDRFMLNLIKSRRASDYDHGGVNLFRTDSATPETYRELGTIEAQMETLAKQGSKADDRAYAREVLKRVDEAKNVLKKALEERGIEPDSASRKPTSKLTAPDKSASRTAAERMTERAKWHRKQGNKARAKLIETFVRSMKKDPAKKAAVDEMHDIELKTKERAAREGKPQFDSLSMTGKKATVAAGRKGDRLSDVEIRLVLEEYGAGNTPDSRLRKLERKYSASPDDLHLKKIYIDALNKAGRTEEAAYIENFDVNVFNGFVSAFTKGDTFKKALNIARADKAAIMGGKISLPLLMGRLTGKVVRVGEVRIGGRRIYSHPDRFIQFRLSVDENTGKISNIELMPEHIYDDDIVIGEAIPTISDRILPSLREAVQHYNKSLKHGDKPSRVDGLSQR